MQSASLNLCSRCGRERIIAKTWNENVQTFHGFSQVKHVVTVCPDTSCQKLIEDELTRQREKQEASTQRRITRMQERSVAALQKRNNLNSKKTAHK